MIDQDLAMRIVNAFISDLEEQGYGVHEVKESYGYLGLLRMFAGFISKSEMYVSNRGVIERLVSLEKKQSENLEKAEVGAEA
jgi:hypothetical protein